MNEHSRVKEVTIPLTMTLPVGEPRRYVGWYKKQPAAKTKP
ncbi:hypothetical protein [Shewanella sp. c952]|nr:hypothetical protein [Shewanella sp. c952]